nr:MAG TPA: hypothetical protein [Bacteriophage sp.]
MKVFCFSLVYSKISCTFASLRQGQHLFKVANIFFTIYP